MKKITTITLLFIATSIFSQNNAKESWSFGLGLSNHTMAGDHRSIMTQLSNGADDNNPFNLGGYIYVDKMINPAFGFELKGHYTTMSGSAQEITSTYLVPDAGNVSLRTTHFDGKAYGAELNAILNFSNMAARPYRTKARRWNVAGYLGIGVQSYDSKLYDNATNAVLIDFGNSPSDDGIANSVYYTGGIGLKYKLTNNFDIELRPTVNLNEEDHLDAARSNKQHMEVFYQTNLGLVFKINGKDHDNYVWQGKDFVEEVIEEVVEKPNFDDMVNAAVNAKLKNMPKVNNDYDGDGFTNDVDSCPFVFSKTNKGCPGDSDKDGVADNIDLCPNTPGLKNNNGCPKPDFGSSTVTTIDNHSNDFISEQIYFALNSTRLTYKSKFDLNAIAIYMLDHPHAMFMLKGNTDRGGSDEYNQKLSETRSQKVKNYLIARGVNPNNIETMGYGESNPKFRDLPVNERNRRVDVMLK
ncbi:MAG: OmpA family protein [Flavobacteriaceae bacterium]